MMESCGPGTETRRPAETDSEQARRPRGLDADELRVRRHAGSAEVAGHGRGEGADAHLHDDEVGSTFAPSL